MVARPENKVESIRKLAIRKDGSYDSEWWERCPGDGQKYCGNCFLSMGF